MLEVVRAEHIEGYRIHVEFNTGERGEVDLQEALWGPVFEPLKDPQTFRRFAVSATLHTVRWENGADLAPEFLHDKMVEQAAADASTSHR